MASNVEIEKKFLVRHDKLPTLQHGQTIKQAYLFTEDTKSLRVRIKGDTCVMTIKIKRSEEVREEYNYPIPKREGERLMKLGARGYLIE